MKRLILTLSVALIVVSFLLIYTAQALVAAKADSRPARPVALAVLDCHETRVQAGVPVKRLSDDMIVHVDVCGAADSSDSTYRDRE